MTNEHLLAALAIFDEEHDAYQVVVGLSTARMLTGPIGHALRNGRTVEGLFYIEYQNGRKTFFAADAVVSIRIWEDSTT
jgi:hypothetical protein